MIIERWGRGLSRNQQMDHAPSLVPRVLIFESRRDCDECARMVSNEGYEVSVCSAPLQLLETFAATRPAVVIYVLGDLDSDLSILSVIREAAPRTPLIVLSGPFELAVRRSVSSSSASVWPRRGGNLITHQEYILWRFCWEMMPWSLPFSASTGNCATRRVNMICTIVPIVSIVCTQISVLRSLHYRL